VLCAKRVRGDTIIRIRQTITGIDQQTDDDQSDELGNPRRENRNAGESKYSGSQADHQNRDSGISHQVGSHRVSLEVRALVVANAIAASQCDKCCKSVKDSRGRKDAMRAAARQGPRFLNVKPAHSLLKQWGDQQMSSARAAPPGRKQSSFCYDRPQPPADPTTARVS
jgi:hypothetical protein